MNCLLNVPYLFTVGGNETTLSRASGQQLSKDPEKTKSTKEEEEEGSERAPKVSTKTARSK